MDNKSLMSNLLPKELLLSGTIVNIVETHNDEIVVAALNTSRKINNAKEKLSGVIVEFIASELFRESLLQNDDKHTSWKIKSHIKLEKLTDELNKVDIPQDKLRTTILTLSQNDQRQMISAIRESYNQKTEKLKEHYSTIFSNASESNNNFPIAPTLLKTHDPKNINNKLAKFFDMVIEKIHPLIHSIIEFIAGNQHNEQTKAPSHKKHHPKHQIKFGEASNGQISSHPAIHKAKQSFKDNKVSQKQGNTKNLGKQNATIFQI